MLATAALRAARADDLPRIAQLLADAGLPAADLTPAHLTDFVLAIDGGTAVGAVGFERHGAHALLRSLVVAPGRRGNGLGAALVEAAEERATDAGLESLTLLTQTAAPFFAARGYAVIARSEAPASVQQSTEFTTLCPSSSLCMTKTLR